MRKDAESASWLPEVKSILELVSESFRYLVPGIIILAAINLAKPTIFGQLRQTLGEQNFLGFVAVAYTLGTLTYAIHRSFFFCLEWLLFFRTPLTAVALYRKEHKIGVLAAWAKFIRKKQNKKSRSWIAYMKHRWGMTHALLMLGEILVVMHFVSDEATTPKTSFGFLTFGIAAFCLGFTTMLMLYHTEKNLLDK